MTKRARLIAAASSLLDAALAGDAAEQHFRDCDYCDEIWCETGTALHRRACELRCAAIAKAEGRSLGKVGKS